MNTVIKLTDEYASNLNCLFFNFDSKLALYYDMFDSIFNDCLLSNDLEIAKYEYSQIIDIVFIKIDNTEKYKNQEDLRNFIRSLRKEKEFLPIYLVKENITDKCYCFDGTLPTPFDREKVYRFLHRILKRLIADKELEKYMEDLEKQLFKDKSVFVATPTKMEDANKVPKKISKEREKDIRFSQTDKISATEFMNFIGDSIIDKVETIEVELDALIGVIYRLENADSALSVDIVQSSIRPIVKEIHVLVESMGYFAVAARAFGKLDTFLATLSTAEFENLEHKALFSTMLLAIINDLEKWLDVIFIQHTTEDIHYLDASFSSNILEIEQVFLECDEDNDDDDLEFF